MSYLNQTGNRRSNRKAGFPPPPPYNEALIQSTISDTSNPHTDTDDHSQSTSSHSTSVNNLLNTNNTLPPSEHTNSGLSTYSQNNTVQYANIAEQTHISNTHTTPTPSPHNSHTSSDVSYDSSTIIQELQRTIKELQLQLALKDIQQSRTAPPNHQTFQPWPPIIQKQVPPFNANTTNNNLLHAPHYAMRMPTNPYATATYTNTQATVPTSTPYAPGPPIAHKAPSPFLPGLAPPTAPISASPPVVDLLDLAQLPPTPINNHQPIPYHNNQNNQHPMQMVTQFKPLTFRQLKDNKSIQAYKIWKSLCHLEISVHSDFTNIIHRSTNGQLSINGYLTEMQSHSIYLATAKAIGESILKVVDPNQTSLGKGQELWAAIDDYYLSNSDTNLLKHETLRDELKSITKNNNETFENYALRYS